MQPARRVLARDTAAAACSDFAMLSGAVDGALTAGQRLPRATSILIALYPEAAV